jgi:hypothetical protein
MTGLIVVRLHNTFHRWCGNVNIVPYHGFQWWLLRKPGKGFDWLAYPRLAESLLAAWIEHPCWLKMILVRA